MDTLQIEAFRLELAAQRLWQGEDEVRLTAKAFAVLRYLVEHREQLVSRDDLFEAVWGTPYVSEAALAACIRELRRALGDSAQQPTFIQTVRGRGYRFVAEVTTADSPVPLIPATACEAPPMAASGVPQTLAVERRQLTVLFCDLVDSTRLAQQLDPEDLREVLQAYHQSCAEVVARFDGYVAQYLGDGVLVYFGYPVAHEDDAQRAVWSGLGLLEALAALNTRLALPAGYQLAVRLGVHTGLVVVGNDGIGERQEPLAQGETPPIAARLQSLAGANELVISSATQELVGGVFRVKDLGAQALPGVAAPLQVYRVLGAQAVASRFEAMTVTSLTPLVGREEELELLWRRWQQATKGEGQVVLLSGEAGLGKSRLTQALWERLGDDPHLRVLYQCSPYHTHSAFYPIVTHLEQTLQLDHELVPAAKLDRLETLLAQAGLPVEEVAPLLAALLSLPSEERYAPLLLSPQRQKERTIEALVRQLVSLSQRAPVLLIFEDAHWSDPTTLEVLDRLIDGLQEASVLAVITARPAFEPRWRSYGHVTTYTLNRLTRRQVASLVVEVTGNKALPTVVLEQIVAKTDGVPLFVEQLTKTVLASGLLAEQGGHYALRRPLAPLAIPATLQDALMARLDGLGSAKAVAQYAAVMGRQVPYALLQAVSPLDEATLQHELERLVEAELFYQRGLPPQSTYMFKHALVQDAAYQSLLRGMRQGYHRRIAAVLAEQFPETARNQPELLAHHYTEASLPDQAIDYWQQAGQRAIERSAYLEAINHLTMGLNLLPNLPDTPERVAQELTLHLALGQVLMATKGQGAWEVEQTYARARALCQEVASTQQLFPALAGLCGFYVMRGALQTARELGEQLLSLADQDQDPALLLQAHQALGGVFLHLGEATTARAHWDHALALCNSLSDRSQATPGSDTRVVCLSHIAWCLWILGYPAQARQRVDAALAQAQALAHPFTLMFALNFAAWIDQFCRQERAAQERLEIVLELTTDLGPPDFLAAATIIRGWALAMQGQREESMAQMRQGLVAYQATGAELHLTSLLALIAEGYLHLGQAEAGLTALEEAFVLVDKNSECYYEAELYRLKGELITRLGVDGHVQAEGYFQQALDIARCQQTKSWELRAAISLSRLWQQRGKRREAYQFLSDIYGWFTEGFDTGDLRAAQGLLVELV